VSSYPGEQRRARCIAWCEERDGSGDGEEWCDEAVAVIMATENREKQPHAVSEGAREHLTIRRSAPAIGASMVGRRNEFSIK